MPLNNLDYANERREDRDDVHHHTTARTPAGAPLALLVVNMSPNGLMARCDAAVAGDERLAIALPDMTPVAATVRWALGGRIGCEFDRALAPRAYLALLPKVGG